MLECHRRVAAAPLTLVILAGIAASGCRSSVPPPATPPVAAGTAEIDAPPPSSAPEPAGDAAAAAEALLAGADGETRGEPAEKPAQGDGARGALEPPDGKWLTDDQGREYFVIEVPRIEGEYVWVDEETVRLRHGLPLKLERYDETTFYAKIFKVDPSAGVQRRRQPPTPEELEAAAATYAIELPAAPAIVFEPFDRGLPKGGQWRNGFAIADVNGDGHADLVAAPPRKGSAFPHIFLGDAEGGWRLWSEARFPNDLRYDYGDVAVADLDGDGHQDLALAMHLLGIRVLRGNGEGAFVDWSEGLDYTIPGNGGIPGYSSRTIEVVDWDADGRKDLLVLGEGMRLRVAGDTADAAGGSFGAAVYLNQGDGSWVRSDIGTDPRALAGDALALADFDGDGATDFAVAAKTLRETAVINLARGESWESVRLPGLRPEAFLLSVAAADFDEDGRPDLAFGYMNRELGVQRTGVDVFLNRTEGGELAWERIPLTAHDGRQGFTALAAGDLDGDGRPDLAATTGVGELRVFLATSGAPWFREVPAAATPLRPTGCTGYRVAIADLDGDGAAEIVANLAGEAGSSVFEMAVAPDRVRGISCPRGGGLYAWKIHPAGG